jgi:hypothetical protein
VLHLLPRFSAASPWRLLLVFCCLASFSDCGGGAARAGKGGAPGDCGADAAHVVPFHYAAREQSPLVFYFTRDVEMVPLVSHDASTWFGRLGTRRCVQTRCGRRTSGR